MNTSWVSISCIEQLEDFLGEHPEYYLVDTRDRERRYYVRSAEDSFGLRVDGRSARRLIWKREYWKSRVTA